MSKMLASFICLVSLVASGTIMSVQDAAACAIAKPAGEVVLTVDGLIGDCNVGLEVQFDMAMIDALPQRDVTTANPWEAAPATYRGVLMRDLLAHVKASGKTIVVAALNDYHAEIDVSQVENNGIILASRRNGDLIPVRDKGPLFVIYPFTDVPELETESNYARSVWQVTRISVK